MRSTEFITESKKIDASKPRNFVAKNAKMGGAGAHKDKKKAQKQGDSKHKQREVAEESDGSKIQQIEAMISQLEQLMPAVMKLQKNHYEFQAIEDEIISLTQPVEQLSDSSARTDMKDAMQTAIEAIRAANGAVYEIEKELKYLLKSANYSLEDARDEAEYESRFGEGPSLEETSDDKLRDYKRRSAGDAINRQNIANRSGEKDPKIAKRNAGQELAQSKLDKRVKEGSNIPFAGKKVGHKEGPAGQLKGNDPKGYPKGKLVGGGM